MFPENIQSFDLDHSKMADCILEFEREALLNVLNENSLTISSKGLLNDRLLFHLVRTFCNSCHLVLVIGCNAEEENSIINQLDEHAAKKSSNEAEDNEFQRPQQVSYLSKIQDRHKLYLGGGVIFITTQILVVDMLTKRLPFPSVTGIIVVNAHRVLKDCHMSFILRLFRQNNKTGFITALSQNASSFLGSYGHLEKCMRKLFVSKLFLWPRFHATIMESLKTRREPKVTEYRIDMTPMMKAIQFTLIDLISRCLKELQSMNSIAYSFETNNEAGTLNTMNVIANNFNKMMHANLDSVWYQLSGRARRFIRDVQLLKSLLFHLTELDSVSFYGEMKHIRNSVTPDSNPPDWIFWPPSDQLFKLSEERVFTVANNGKKMFHCEINPKLDALMDLLKDLEKQITEEQQQQPLGSEDKIVDAIIVVENLYTVRQIERFLDKGREVILEELKAKCDLFSSGKKIELFRKAKPQQATTDKTQEEDEIFEFEDQLTLTQMICKVEDHETSVIRKSQSFQIQFYEWSDDNNCGLGLKHLLQMLKPKFVILYEPEMSAIRQIEIHQAIHGDQNSPPIEVIFFIFDGSAEEQRYLRNMQVEKDSFEKLIEEKFKLPNVKENEGIVGEHPDLVRGKPELFHPDELLDAKAASSSRIGGNKLIADPKPDRSVLVDLREFRSQLPSFIHKIGIDLIPVTLEIGDYIITPDCCIERKAIPDLIQSLNSGRLYSQAQIMTRHYKRPLLLIEFPDDPKSFNFQSRCWGPSIMNTSSTGNSGGNTNFKPNPLVQLAVLTIQFPLLRLVWSPKATFTAEIIDRLKQGKEEPNPDTDIIRLTDSWDGDHDQLPIEYMTDRFDIEVKEFLLCLPGITPANIYTVMNRFQSITDLVQQSIEELTEHLGSSRHAKLLYSALHDPVRFDDDSDQSKQQKAKEKRFTHLRKRKQQKP